MLLPSSTSCASLMSENSRLPVAGFVAQAATTSATTATAAGLSRQVMMTLLLESTRCSLRSPGRMPPPRPLSHGQFCNRCTTQETPMNRTKRLGFSQVVEIRSTLWATSRGASLVRTRRIDGARPKSEGADRSQAIDLGAKFGDGVGPCRREWSTRRSGAVAGEFHRRLQTRNTMRRRHHLRERCGLTLEHAGLVMATIAK